MSNTRLGNVKNTSAEKEKLMAPDLEDSSLLLVILLLWSHMVSDFP